jgi:hypothetical protein
MIGRLNGLFDGIFAHESWTLSQSYYFGSVNANPAHRVEVCDGMPIDLLDELDHIWLGKPDIKPNGANGINGQFYGGPVDIKALTDAIISGASYHESCTRLVGKLAQQDVAFLDAQHRLEAAFDQVEDDNRDERWRERRADIPRIVRDIYGKDARGRDEEEATQQQQTSAGAACPIIRVEKGLRYEAADQGLNALIDANVQFFQRNRKIQRVTLVKAKNASGETMMVPGITDVCNAMLSRELGRSAVWTKYDGRHRGYARIDPPSEVCTQILAMVGEWPFSPLRGVIGSPTLRRDGSLLDKQGYDEATGFVLVNSISMPPIPARPTKDDAQRALELFKELLVEFPFVDEESRAVALSMILTPVVRAAMEVSPLHLVSKPKPGTGGSYLADVASMIATGERCPVEAATSSYEETEKRLIGSVLDGVPIICLDNVHDVISGDFFSQMVERPLLNLRALGSSDKHRIDNAHTMFATGNNITVAADLVRRSIRCDLDANVEYPGDRVFEGNPRATIAADRGKYIAAALTIPLAYLSAGSPQPKAPLISFEDWSRFVREPLIWLDCADPVETQKKAAHRRPAQVRRSRGLRGVEGRDRSRQEPQADNKATHGFIRIESWGRWESRDPSPPPAICSLPHSAQAPQHHSGNRCNSPRKMAWRPYGGHRLRLQTHSGQIRCEQTQMVPRSRGRLKH